MDLTDALPPDELLLARLTVTKLAKIMQGFVSVGTTTLQMESPTDFLAGRDKTGLGFLEVLRCIAVKPNHVDKIELLRKQVGELAAFVRSIHAQFIELAHWRSMSVEDIHATINRLDDAYTQFCGQLGAFCSLIGLQRDYSDQARQGKMMLDAFSQMVFAQQADATP